MPRERRMREAATGTAPGGFRSTVSSPSARCYLLRAGELGERPGAVRSAGHRPLPNPPPQAGEGKNNKGGGAATGGSFSLRTFSWTSKRKYADRGSGTAIIIYYIR